MELVAGEDLGRILKREGPMPFRRAAQIAVQVCNSMIEAHERGIVHRDIKPENILVVHPGGRAERRRDGVQDLVKVLDFGLAKLHDEERPHANEVTTSGAIVGTPFYMAPEQIRGEAVDGRADIYALGAVIYRAITGVPPFTASTPMGVLTQHLTEPLIPAHVRAPDLGVPEEASAIISKAMSKERDERYAAASDLRDALVEYLAAIGVESGQLRHGALEAISQTQPSMIERLRPSRGEGLAVVPATRRDVRSWARARQRTLALVVATLALVAFVGIAIAAWMREGPRFVPTLEREPNDTRAGANVLSLGAPTRAFLGKRLGPDRADVDWFRFEIPEGSPDELIEIALAPLPNIPLCVELLGDGEQVRGSFCQPRGVPLKVSAFRVAPGTHYLRVTQDRAPERGGPEDGARPPVFENVSDTYAIRVAVVTPAQDLEVEPNDDRASAHSLARGDRVAGHIGWRDDRDVFCAREAGTFVVVARGAAGLAADAALLVEAPGGDRVVGDGPVRVDVQPEVCVTIHAGARARTASYEIAFGP
jgi:serine/threonine-protein kinase